MSIDQRLQVVAGDDDTSHVADATTVERAVQLALGGQSWILEVRVSERPPRPARGRISRPIRVHGGRVLWASVTWEGDDPLQCAFVALALDAADAQNRASLLEEQRAQLSERVEIAQQRMIDRSRIEALGTIAASLAHDLRSPLTALVAGLDYLEHRLGDLAKQDHELLELFEDNRLTLDSIEGLLSGMAAFTGAHSILGPVSTIGVVESAVQLTRWCTRRKGLAVSTHLAADVQARGTMSELVQIVVNLLTNATDEAPQRSTIHVCVVAAPEKAFIYVLDEGRGVPRALARAIFEPFHTSKANGMGLGLSIAREMAQRNGGDLYVCYDPPPELPRTAGACFALELARS